MEIDTDVLLEVVTSGKMDGCLGGNAEAVFQYKKNNNIIIKKRKKWIWNLDNWGLGLE